MQSSQGASEPRRAVKTGHRPPVGNVLMARAPAAAQLIQKPAGLLGTPFAARYLRAPALLPRGASSGARPCEWTGVLCGRRRSNAGLRVRRRVVTGPLSWRGDSDGGASRRPQFAARSTANWARSLALEIVEEHGARRQSSSGPVRTSSRDSRRRTPPRPAPPSSSRCSRPLPARSP